MKKCNCAFSAAKAPAAWPSWPGLRDFEKSLRARDFPGLRSTYRALRAGRPTRHSGAMAPVPCGSSLRSGTPLSSALELRSTGLVPRLPPKPGCPSASGAGALAPPDVGSALGRLKPRGLTLAGSP